jgi:hypothetical protein
LKKTYSFIAFLVIAAAVEGQAPTSFNYQSVLRDAEGVMKSDKVVIVEFEIVYPVYED